MPFCKLKSGKSTILFNLTLLAEIKHRKWSFSKYFYYFRYNSVPLRVYPLANLLPMQESKTRESTIWFYLSIKHLNKSFHNTSLPAEKSYSLISLCLSTFVSLLITSYHLNVLSVDVNLVPPSTSWPYRDSEWVEYPWRDMVFDGPHGGDRRRLPTAAGPDRVDASLGSSREYRFQFHYSDLSFLYKC